LKNMDTRKRVVRWSRTSTFGVHPAVSSSRHCNHFQKYTSTILGELGVVPTIVSANRGYRLLAARTGRNCYGETAQPASSLLRREPLQPCRSTRTLSACG
jgi:hypothetical protein